MSKWGKWKLNPSLDVLKRQMQVAHPGINIGTIADDNHTPPSDHIPNRYDRVNAIDLMVGKAFTKDECDSVVRFLITDKRVKYVIWYRKIWTPADGWKTYTRSDPHTGHAHVSVLDSSHTATQPWRIKGRDVLFRNLSGYMPTLVIGDEDPIRGSHYVARAQVLLNFCNNNGKPDYVPLKIDGVYQKKTAAAVERLLPELDDDGGAINTPVWVRLLAMQNTA